MPPVTVPALLVRCLPARAKVELVCNRCYLYHDRHDNSGLFATVLRLFLIQAHVRVQDSLLSCVDPRSTDLD